MALQLNLLHEEFSEQRQRQRDPLKLGLMALGAFGVILFLYYGWNAYRTIQIKRQLALVQSDWNKVEPKVTAAQKRAEELRKIIDGAKVLDGLSDGRFLWAPLLATLSHCVAPNIQLIGLSGSFGAAGDSVLLSVEGIGAAREPRAVAEEFRQLLFEQLEKKYQDVKVDFRNLEDLDTLVNLAGLPSPSARFALDISFHLKSARSDKSPGATASPKEAAK
jgi:hypothetical protein